MTTTRLFRGLALLLYGVGLLLPVGGDNGPQSVGFLVAYSCFCGMVVVPVAFVEQPGSLLTLSCASLLAIALAHPLLWWSWLVHALRRPLHASITSGIACVLWLVFLLVSQGPTHPDHGVSNGGRGYWLCFAGMAGSCLSSVLRCRAAKAERLRSSSR